MEAFMTLNGLPSTFNGKPMAAYYPYLDGDDIHLGTVVRYEDLAGKQVIPFFKLEGKEWKPGALTENRPLFGLNILKRIDSKIVYVVEGEKCAQAMQWLGLPVVTSSGGSSQAAKTDWRPVLSKDKVILLPDNDEPGKKYLNDVAEEIFALSPSHSIGVVNLTKLPTGGDVVDWIKNHVPNWDGLSPIPEANRDELRRLLLTEIKEGVKRYERLPASNSRKVQPALVRVADVASSAVQWLWPEKIALGKLTLLVGDPGLGKSFLSLDIAARVSSGFHWPARGGKVTQGSVILLSAEDDISDTIRPRLEKARAKIDQISVLKAVRIADKKSGKINEIPFSLDRDLEALEQSIKQIQNVKLVVIDPITAYLGNCDSHKNSDVRAILAPLSDIAAKYRVAVVAITHLNKSSEGSVLNRASGSNAFPAAARAVWFVTKDKDNSERRLFLSAKNNLAREPQGLSFTIVNGEVVWDIEPITTTLGEALTSDESLPNNGALDEAKEWLIDKLSKGPVPANSIKADAKIDGIKERTLDRAKQALGIRSGRVGFSSGGEWSWLVPRECKE